MQRPTPFNHSHTTDRKDLMRICMIDCEMFALTADAFVLQISAGAYDLASGEMRDLRAWWPMHDEQLERRIDPGTVAWWMQQSDAARAAVFGAPGHARAGTHRDEIARELQLLIDAHSLETVWAKPAMTDLALLEHYFGRQVWDYRAARDMQTVVQLFDPTGQLQPPKQAELAHDASYDVQWQCDYLREVFKATGGFGHSPGAADEVLGLRRHNDALKALIAGVTP
jgi:hypothetical protein